jgi:hypothetical protein
MHLFRAAFFVVPIVALPLAVAVACGPKRDDNPPTLGTNPSPGTPPAGGGPRGDASVTGDGGCPSTLVNTAPVVTQAFVGETLPAPLGGTITGGTYFLTAANVYTGVSGNAGPTGLTFEETLTLDTSQNAYSDALAEATLDGGIATATLLTTGTFTTQATSLILSAQCPVATSTTTTYSVLNSALHIFQGQSEFIYTAQ